MRLKSRALRIVSGIIVPFVLQALLGALVIEFQEHLFFLRNISEELLVFVLVLGPLTISSVAGFAILVREFRSRAILLGLVYFPVVLYLLFNFSILFGGIVYGDWP